jgi:hypothetical protein
MPPPTPSAESPQPGPDPNAALMSRFSSMGENCEFGLAQRAFGAEPLDLLRWAAIFPKHLINMLRQKFENIGKPELLRAELSRPGGEYMVRNLQYNCVYHAFVKDGELTPEQIVAREARRLPRLAEKLMEELAEGYRIFIRMPVTVPMSDDLPALVEAMRGYGSPTLLYVTVADEAHPAFSIERQNDILIHAYIDRFAKIGALHSTVPTDSWLRICQTVAAMVPERT